MLARNVDTYFSQYNKTVMEQLYADGFINPINKPRQTVQDGWCVSRATTCLPLPPPPAILPPHNLPSNSTPYSETDLWTCDVHDHPQ